MSKPLTKEFDLSRLISSSIFGEIISREIISPNIDELISLDKSNSLVRGFDITSAFLQQETIKVEAQAKCDNGLFQSFKSIDLRYSKDNNEKLFFYTNEWLKKQQ